MEFREKLRVSKSRENAIKEKEDKEKKEKIKDLLPKIKINNLQDSDLLSYLIINCFMEKNYTPLQINEIHTLLSRSKKFEVSLKKYNLRNDIMCSLATNNIFHNKKNNTYELYFDRTLNYLTSFLESSISNSNINGSNSISKMSKEGSIENNFENGFVQNSPVFNFPEEQNSTVNFNVEDNSLQQIYSYSSDDGNAFTFGEHSQIKANKINNKQDDEEIIVEYNEDDLKKFSRNNFTENEFNELEKKSNEKFIDNFETLFDKNQYLSNLKENLKNLLKLYKKNNENKTNISDLENKIFNHIYSLFKDLELNNIKQYNEKSASFNEEKSELINIFKAIKSQYDSLKLIKSIDSTKEKNIKDIQQNEKAMMKELIDEIKNIFQKLQRDYEETKLYEKQINENISKVKLHLREICEQFLEKKKELYQDFYTLVNNIENYPIELIKININDTVKCFYCYIDEVEKYYLDI